MILEKISKELKVAHALQINHEGKITSIDIELDLAELMEIKKIVIKSTKLVKKFKKFCKRDDKYLDKIFEAFIKFNNEKTSVSIGITKLAVTVVIEERYELN